MFRLQGTGNQCHSDMKPYNIYPGGNWHYDRSIIYQLGWVERQKGFLTWLNSTPLIRIDINNGSLFLITQGSPHYLYGLAKIGPLIVYCVLINSVGWLLSNFSERPIIMFINTCTLILKSMSNVLTCIGIFSNLACQKKSF